MKPAHGWLLKMWDLLKAFNLYIIKVHLDLLFLFDKFWQESRGCKIEKSKKLFGKRNIQGYPNIFIIIGTVIGKDTRQSRSIICKNIEFLLFLFLPAAIVWDLSSVVTPHRVPHHFLRFLAAKTILFSFRAKLGEGEKKDWEFFPADRRKRGNCFWMVNYIFFGDLPLLLSWQSFSVNFISD